MHIYYLPIYHLSIYTHTVSKTRKSSQVKKGEKWKSLFLQLFWAKGFCLALCIKHLWRGTDITSILVLTIHINRLYSFQRCYLTQWAAAFYNRHSSFPSIDVSRARWLLLSMLQLPLEPQMPPARRGQLLSILQHQHTGSHSVWRLVEFSKHLCPQISNQKCFTSGWKCKLMCVRDMWFWVCFGRESLFYLFSH